MMRKVRGLLSDFSVRRRRQLQLMVNQAAYRRYDIGRFSYGSPDVRFSNSGAMLRIGQFCSIADGVQIFLGGEHRTDWVTTYPFSLMIPDAARYTGHPSSRGDVVIGNDVWIGHGAFLLSGVKIGDGAVVGARALVARDVAPYSIVAGNPARLIRQRFTDSQVAGLLRIQWWNWPISKISAEVPMLLSSNIDAFLARHLPNDAQAPER